MTRERTMGAAERRRDPRQTVVPSVHWVPLARMQFRFTSGAFTRAALGPAAELRLRADGIHADALRLANYANGFWEVGGHFFTHGHCTSPVFVHAQGGAAPTAVDGPLAAVRLVDGAVWNGETLLYQLQDDGRWLRPGQSGSWDEVVLRDAAPV